MPSIAYSPRFHINVQIYSSFHLANFVESLTEKSGVVTKWDFLPAQGTLHAQRMDLERKNEKSQWEFKRYIIYKKR